MNLPTQIALAACFHAAFIFTAYGTKFFGLPLPSDYFVPLWLVVPATLAFAAYLRALLKTKYLASALYREGLWVFCAGLAALSSTYMGVFFALNTFGE